VEISQDDQDTPRPVRPGGAQPVRGPIFTTFPQPAGIGNNNGRPMLPIVRPGTGQQATQNDGGQAQQPIAIAPPSAAPSPTPGQSGFGGVSAPGMIAAPPASSQPGQIAQPQQ
jgi:hypothetical protein